MSNILESICINYGRVSKCVIDDGVVNPDVINDLCKLFYESMKEGGLSDYDIRDVIEGLGVSDVSSFIFVILMYVYSMSIRDESEFELSPNDVRSIYNNIKRIVNEYRGILSLCLDLSKKLGLGD